MSGTETVLSVRVTAGDGTTRKTYTVTVTQEGDEFACEPPDLSDRSEVWAATITVGGNDVGPLWGYDTPSSAEGGNYGALSDTSFEFGGNSYTIVAILSLSDSPLDSLVFRNRTATVPEDDWDELRLHICADTFELAEANLQPGGSQNQLRVSSVVFAGKRTHRRLRLVPCAVGAGGAVDGERGAGVRRGRAREPQRWPRTPPRASPSVRR